MHPTTLITAAVLATVTPTLPPRGLPLMPAVSMMPWFPPRETPPNPFIEIMPGLPPREAPPNPYSEIYPDIPPRSVPDLTAYLNVLPGPGSSCANITAPGIADLASPCNAFTLLSEKCIYGAPAGSVRFLAWSKFIFEHPGEDLAGFQLSRTEKPMSAGEQRVCACTSHFFEQWAACDVCGAAQLGDGGVDVLGLDKTREQYCAVDVEPTYGIEELALLKLVSPPVSSPTGIDVRLADYRFTPGQYRC